MQQYRIDNQALFARNFMPHMLGWYLLTETTTRAEMEWMLARAAGYGAGFAMVARPKALRANPLTPQLLDAIREWEAARLSRAFDSAQVARLKDPAREFHLERVADGAWRLYETAMSPIFTRTRVERQPGEPTQTEWPFEQRWDEQRLQFRLRVTAAAGATGAGAPGATGTAGTGTTAGTVRALRLTVDRYAALALPVELRLGESLVVDGTDVVRLYDATGKPKGRFTLSALPPVLARGAHLVQMESEFTDDGLAVEVQFRGMGAAEPVRAKR
jgi:hypothetical protein